MSEKALSGEALAQLVANLVDATLVVARDQTAYRLTQLDGSDKSFKAARDRLRESESYVQELQDDIASRFAATIQSIREQTLAEVVERLEGMVNQGSYDVECWITGDYEEAIESLAAELKESHND